MSGADYRETSFNTWERMASGWQRSREYVWDASRKVGESLVEALDPKPGQTILELACGVGDTGFMAASRVGDEGRLIATDFSPGMIEAARSRAQELGLRNVEFRVMDAENMDLGDDSADGVLCRWGYMLMADPAAALAETRRVLRDGGRLAFSVWGPPERNVWAAITGAALVQGGHMDPPQPGSPGIFAMASPDRIRELVTGAGFAEPRIEEVEVVWRFEDFEDYWRFVNELAGACALVIEKLDEDEQQPVREAMLKATAPFERDGQLAMPGVALNAVTS
jgi:ubiquinone/menaquinone biosynthesis C-methylase UbiE